MKKIICISLFFPLIIFLPSCGSQRKSVFVPVPDSEYFIKRKIVEIDRITETRSGVLTADMPQWLLAFLNGGIEEVERLPYYSEKYIYIGYSEGVNYSALNRWAENYSAWRDFFILAAQRIENRMILSAVLYPDDEYGSFFETMVKKAYNAEYPGVVKEDTYWVKSEIFNDSDEPLINPEMYNFFILLTIDKTSMQSIIRNMLAEAVSGITPISGQRNAINRLRQNFFNGF